MPSSQVFSRLQPLVELTHAPTYTPLGLFLYLKYLCGSMSLLTVHVSSVSNGVPTFAPLLYIFQECGKEAVVCLWSPVGVIPFQVAFSSAVLLGLLYNSVMSSSELRDRRSGFQLQWLVSLNISFLLCKMCYNNRWHFLCQILQNYERCIVPTWKLFIGHQILIQNQMWEATCNLAEWGLDKVPHF